jgi:hypothetical protein
MMSIKVDVTKEDIKNILGSNKMKLEFIEKMIYKWKVPTKINRKRQMVVDIKSIGDLDEFIISNWNYEVCRDMLREMFILTEKYKRGQTAKIVFNHFKQKYQEVGFSDYKWPFISGQFDDYLVKSIVYPSVANSEVFDTQLVKIDRDVEKFSYLKVFNTLRNDYIEYLMFKSDEDIIPTFSHRGGIDFYIHGLGFDQKVSRSVTNQFMDKHGENWRNKALENPFEVAEFLMVLGDEARFSNVPRLFVIDVDGSYELDGIEEQVCMIEFDSPTNVTYTYQHKSTGSKQYTCPVICLMLTQG